MRFFNAELMLASQPIHADPSKLTDIKISHRLRLNLW